MFSLDWFSAVISYALESAIELLIIFLVVEGVTLWKGLNHPAAKSRFLMLPLIIPVFFSPAFHLIFPWLERFAIIAQIEKTLPILSAVRSQEKGFVAPFLIVAFVLLLAYNLLTGLAVSLREVRNNWRFRVFVRGDDQKTLSRLASQFEVSRSLLSTSRRHPNAAYVFGWKHPIVILGCKCLHQLDVEEVEAVLAHELAHFKRGDNWKMLVAKTCRDLMFFNPLAHFIYNRHNEACEQAADDLALRVTHKPLSLASSLLKFWRMRQIARVPIGSAGFTSHPRVLENRIRRLCDYPQTMEAEPARDGLFYCLSIALTVTLSVI